MSAEHTPPEPQSQPMSAANAAGVSVLFGSVGSLFVFTLGAWHWLETKELLAGGIFVVALVVIGVTLYSKRASHAAIALIAALAAAAPLAAWDLSEVRSNVLSSAGGLIPAVTLRRALADRDPKVGTEACVALLNRGYDEIRHTSHEFAESPESTMACLKDPVEGTDAEDLLRRDVLWMWREALLEGKSTGDDSCALVEPFVTLLPAVYPEDVAPRLLNLSLASSSSDVRACVRAKFDEMYSSPLKQLKGLGDPRRVEKKVQESLFVDLVRSSYAADLPADAERPVNNPMLEQWTLSLGCSVLDVSEDTPRTVRYLNTAMIAQKCGAVMDEDGSAAVWSDACVETVDKKTGFVTQQELCERIRTHAVNEAVEFARTEVWGAIEIMRWRALHDSVKEGSNMTSAQAAAQRFIPTDAMEAALANSSHSSSLIYDTMGGIHQTRRYSGSARRHMRKEKMKRGVDRKMMEIFIAAANSDEITVTDDEGKPVALGDIRGQLKSEGVDVEKIFSKKRIGEATKLADGTALDEENEMTVDELLNGLEKTDEEKEEEERKEREQKDPAKQQGSAKAPL